MKKSATHSASHLRHQAGLREQPAKIRRAAEKANAQRTLQVDTVLEKFTDLYDFAPVGYFTLAPDGTIQRVNLTGASMAGMQRSSLLGQHFGTLLDPRLRGDFNVFLAQAFDDDARLSADFEMLRPDQPLLIVNIAAKRQNTPKECHVVVMDITDRKKVEDILRRNEALFSALLNRVPIGVYVVDDQLRLIQVNSKALPIFKNVQPLIGQDYAAVIHVLWSKRIADQIIARLQHTLKTGEPYMSVEFEERRKDTQVREAYEWQIQRVILPSGDHRVVCFFSDITERKRAEKTQRRVEVLAASNKKLKLEIIRRQTMEAALTKSEHLAKALLKQSRELQKKLRGASHQNLLALENQRKEISHELHDKISQVLIGINVRLAVFTRTAGIDAKDMAPVRELVEQSVRIVHDYARELRPAMLDQLGLIPTLSTYIDEISRQRGLKIRLTASPKIEALDNDKRTLLYRVAQEALINIVEHAEARNVSVTLRHVRGRVCLEITDDGKAFDVDLLSSPQWNHRLGLAGMRERVEMAHGEFGIVSAPGKGTKIHAVIPVGKIRPRH